MGQNGIDGRKKGEKGRLVKGRGGNGERGEDGKIVKGEEKRQEREGRGRQE